MENNMIDKITVGPVPSDENCAQVGQVDYYEQAKKECTAYVKQLKRQFGQPDGVSFVITSNPHDFGTYYEVAVKFHDDVESELAFALRVNHELPSQWDDEAKTELGI